MTALPKPFFEPPRRRWVLTVGQLSWTWVVPEKVPAAVAFNAHAVGTDPHCHSRGHHPRRAFHLLSPRLVRDQLLSKRECWLR